MFAPRTAPLVPLIVSLFAFTNLSQLSAKTIDSSTEQVIHIAALGDSITRAFNADGPIDHPWNSWATGNSDDEGIFKRGKVKSHAEMLSDLTGKSVHVHNVARSGAKSEDLDRQVESLKGVKITYATLLIGANDLCAHTHPLASGKQADMTKFSGHVESAIAKLILRNPEIKILLVSIPDMPRLQRLGQGTSCQARWTTLGLCQNLLRERISTEDLSLFERQWHDANDNLKSIATSHSDNVLYNPRLAEYPFEREHLSDIDCFHPNIVGQNLLSYQTWITGWWGQ